MRRQSEAEQTTVQRVRCAIYTRKSTEENLDSEFNSLDAQREAGEAYVSSQRHEGWMALPIRYDDGGFSGGNLERPGLRRLLDDIEAGRVDCVLVYKLDRLSRSLLDFVKLIEVFDRHNVSFVSVTQRFDTSTSMGRLMLNILLSFAQFEREIIGERIRDKVAATKRKGKYCGGMPVLGYDADRERKRLVVNSTEAEVVRHIFRSFVRNGSTTEIAKELNAAGVTTKSWLTKRGSLHAGVPWHKMHVYRVLNNPIYLGEVTHKSKRYPGEHEAIVPRPLWDQAHAILARNHRARGAETRTKQPALLRGILKCGHCHCSMGPTYTNRHGRMYRYYHCMRAAREGTDSCPTRTLAAGEIEGAVIEHLRGVFRAPELVAATFRAAREQMTQHLEQLAQQRTDAELTLQTLREETERLTASEASLPVSTRLGELRSQMEEQELALHHLNGEIETANAAVFTEQEVIDALSALDPVWEQLFPNEQARIVKLLVDRVEVHPKGAEVHLRVDGLRSLVDELRDNASTETKELDS